MKNFLLIILLMMIAGCGAPITFERSEISMGTVITIKAEGKNSQAAVEESFIKIAELEKNISVDIKNIEDAYYICHEKFFVDNFFDDDCGLWHADNF